MDEPVDRDDGRVDPDVELFDRMAVTGEIPGAGAGAGPRVPAAGGAGAGDRPAEPPRSS